MEKSDFDSLLKRYLAGETTEKETAKVEAWLDVMRAEGHTDVELSKADEDRIFKKLSSNLDNLDEVTTLLPKKKKGLSSGQWTLRIAASLSLVALLSYALWQYTGIGEGTGFFAGNIDKLILNDGSLVWLRGESKFTYFEKQDDGTRYGELTGEALFEVAKDPDHPFIIRCGDVTIKVLGTSFSLKSSGDELELKVLTGKVNLSTDANKEGIVVVANEKVIYKPSGEILRSSLEDKDVQKITKHTQYNMTFKNASLQDVLERMEEKFSVDITMLDKEAGQCSITADFTDHSLDSSLDMITEVLDVTYAKEGNMITITGVGCP